MSSESGTSTQSFAGAGEAARHEFSLRPVNAHDADALFPQIFQTPITNTIQWDGPENLAAYREGLSAKEAACTAGREHMFTIYAGERAAGSASFRPYEDGYRADIGLWIGETFQAQGIGTQAVKELVNYGFQRPNIQKIEASVFLENWASRRIFEKNGFLLEGTVRAGARKRGNLIDEWLLGLLRKDYETHHPLEK
jgi:RimJ/RimL family protein N-acetyltransferase